MKLHLEFKKWFNIEKVFSLINKTEKKKREGKKNKKQKTNGLQVNLMHDFDFI